MISLFKKKKKEGMKPGNKILVDGLCYVLGREQEGKIELIPDHEEKPAQEI